MIRQTKRSLDKKKFNDRIIISRYGAIVYPKSPDFKECQNRRIKMVI